MCFGYKFFVVFMNWGMPQKNLQSFSFTLLSIFLTDTNTFLTHSWPTFPFYTSWSLFLGVSLSSTSLFCWLVYHWKLFFLETYCSTKLFWDINSQNSHLMLRDEERVFKKARCFYLKTSLSMRAFLEEAFYIF